MKTVVAIPAFNEERTIAKVIVRAKAYADKVVVVDDGSSDDTGLIAEGLGATVVTHKMNLGRGAALRDCFQWARDAGVEVLVTLDADGQHDPSQIPILLDAMRKKEADVVIGSRSSRRAEMPWHRWLGKRSVETQVKIGDRVVDAQSGFRAYSRRAIENLVAAEYGMGVDSEVLLRAHRWGMKIIGIPVDIYYARLQTSSHNSIIHAFDVFFGILKFISISHPLTFYGGFGVGALIVSLLFGFMTLDYYQQWGRVITNLALVSVAAGVLGFLSLFTGIILFTLITVAREQRH